MWAHRNLAAVPTRTQPRSSEGSVVAIDVAFAPLSPTVPAVVRDAPESACPKSAPPLPLPTPAGVAPNANAKCQRRITCPRITCPHITCPQ
jgi:hypothetical protein